MIITVLDNSDKYPPIGEQNDIEIAFSRRKIPKIIDEAEIISATKKGSINKRLYTAH